MGRTVFHLKAGKGVAVGIGAARDGNSFDGSTGTTMQTATIADFIFANFRPFGFWYELLSSFYYSLRHLLRQMSYHILGVGLFTVFENCFLFSKIRKTGKTCFVSIFFSFLVMKNIENKKKTIHSENKKQFPKNSFQKQKSNRLLHSGPQDP